jgi:hypothetical protein
MGGNAVPLRCTRERTKLEIDRLPDGVLRRKGGRTGARTYRSSGRSECWRLLEKQFQIF